MPDSSCSSKDSHRAAKKLHVLNSLFIPNSKPSEIAGSIPSSVTFFQPFPAITAMLATTVPSWALRLGGDGHFNGYCSWDDHTLPQRNVPLCVGQWCCQSRKRSGCYLHLLCIYVIFPLYPKVSEITPQEKDFGGFLGTLPQSGLRNQP